LLPPKPCEGTWFTNYVRKRLPLAGEAGSPQARLMRWSLPICRCPMPYQRQPPCPLRPFGAPPPMGGGLYRAIVKSTLPQLFIIHQRSGFIIQYSFVPTPYHPGCPFRRHCAEGDVCGRSQNAPTCQCVIVRHRAKGSLRPKPPLPKGG